MPAAVQLWSNEPILVLAFSGAVDENSVSEAYLDALDQARMAGDALYWLVDVRGAAQSSALIASTLKEIVMGVAGAPVMPAVNMAFIAQPGVTADLAWKTPPSGWFTDYDAAVNHARAHFAETLHAH